MNTYEVILIGGGPAGMSAALVLGRSRIKTLIITTESPRNGVTIHSHGFLTQDGKAPAEILATAKKQLEKYNAVTYLVDEAIDLSKSKNGFIVKTNKENYQAKRVIIATGHKDNLGLLNINGLNAVYGQSVYPCPFCDGFELADQKLAVIGDADTALPFSKIISFWSDDIMVFTNGEKATDTTLAEQLNAQGIQIIESRIKQLHSKNGQLESIETEDGIYERTGGFLSDTKAAESTLFAQQLNLPKEIDSKGKEIYKVNESHETDIKGLFIIGDAKTGWSGVSGAVAEGSKVGIAITHQLIGEKWS